MPARLRYEGTGLLVPKEVVAAKEKQLKFGIEQFMSKYLPFTTGIYIVFKWAFVLPHYVHKKDLTLFRVELLNLSTGETQVRSWEMKEDSLVSDTIYNHPRPFVLTGYRFAEWYQELFGHALNEKKNKSLDKALRKAAVLFKLSVEKIEILEGSCKVNLAWGKEYGGIEYKIKVKACDGNERIREYNWLLETDPFEDRYFKFDKSSQSPKRTPLRSRAGSVELPEEANTTLKAFKITNYKGSPFKNLQIIGNNMNLRTPSPKNEQLSPLRPMTPSVLPMMRLFTPLKNTFYNRNQLNTNFDPKEFSPFGGNETTETPKKPEGGTPIFVPGRIKKHFRLFNTPINIKKKDLNKTFGNFS